ncbi:SITS-binding protein-like [Saccostrea echinata]|uniref:SITS-binding protein-like n=1 Tax=Saccostrea echinata TaxID=191078 RepID=UPI002A805A52|nr:SITS-binding protein-like [Saccostrea echinata]
MGSRTENTTVNLCEHENDKLLTVGNDDNLNKKKYVSTKGEGSLHSLKTTPGGVEGRSNTLNSHSPSSKSTEVKAEDSNMKIPNWRKKVLKVTVTIMFFVMAIGVIVIWTLHEGGGEILKEDGVFTFDIDERELFINLKQNENALKLKLGGDDFKTLAKETSVSDQCKDPTNKYCYVLKDGTAVYLRSSQMNGVQCYQVSWKNLTSFLPEDCFELNHGHWYGLVNKQNPSGNTWPIQNLQISKQTILAGYNKDLGDIYEYYWLSSTGTTFYIVDDFAVQISFNHSNSNKFCVSPVSRENLNSLEYAVCQGTSIKIAHIGTSKKFGLQPAISFNSTDLGWMFEYVWDTQTLGVEDRSNLVNFILNNVSSNNLNCGLLEIPLSWEEHFGDFRLSINLSQSVFQELMDLKCNMIYKVFPVSSFESSNFISGIRSKMFAINSFSSATYLLDYRNKQCAVWDLGKQHVQTFILKELNEIANNFHVKKFDLQSIPSVDGLDGHWPSRSKEFYKYWLHLLNNMTGLNFQEETFRTQSIPSAVEILFKQHSNEKNASQTCMTNSIPNLLTLSLFGYPLLISALDLSEHNPIDPDILLRWLQVSAFIPAIKVPMAALMQNTNLLSYANKDILDLHNSIYKKMDFLNYLEGSDEPFIRPLWWLDPDDSEALTISDQFLVGDKYLVAPLFCSGQRSRDIYLPKTADRSVWQYIFRNGTIRNFAAGGWLRQFRVSLFNIPYFTRKVVLPISDD